MGGAACTPKALRRLIEMLGVYTSPHPGSVSTGKLWLHGFSAREPHFRQKLVKALKDHARGLADGEFLLEQSHSLVGVADPSGTVPEGEIVYFAGGRAEPGQVLLYGAASILATCARSMRATRPSSCSIICAVSPPTAVMPSSSRPEASAPSPI